MREWADPARLVEVGWGLGRLVRRRMRSATVTAGPAVGIPTWRLAEANVHSSAGRLEIVSTGTDRRRTERTAPIDPPAVVHGLNDLNGPSAIAAAEATQTKTKTSTKMTKTKIGTKKAMTMTTMTTKRTTK